MKNNKAILHSTLLIALLQITLISGCKKEEDTATATCSDGIQNQNETGVDCGGSCNACTPPVACFTSNRTTASIGEEFVFTNCSTGGDSYAWSFGDGNTSTGFSPTHRYLSSGNKTVSLSVTNAHGTTTQTAVVSIVVNSATYAGNYHVAANCMQSGSYNYDATIAPSGATEVSLSNFYNKGQTITGTVSGSGLSINNQGIFGITINGSGTLSPDFNTVNMNYTAVGGPYNDNCAVVYTRY